MSINTDFDVEALSEKKRILCFDIQEWTNENDWYLDRRLYGGRREREIILVEDKEENAKGIRDIYQRWDKKERLKDPAKKVL